MPPEQLEFFQRPPGKTPDERIANEGDDRQKESLFIFHVVQ
jgi:hypothetical protein